MPDQAILDAIATTAIPGDSPVGESLRYDEAFARLEAEVGKLENPAGGEVDWRVVEEGAIELLTTRSKDVLLAAWLARALWQREGLSGLAAGIETIRRLCEAFWEPLHPQRLRPRRAALEWLGEKLAAILGDDQLAADPVGVQASVTAIDGMIALAAARFEGEDCGLMALYSRLRSAGVPASSGEASASASPVDDAPRAAASSAPAGPIANRAQAIARLKELAEWWARHEPSSPMVPLLNRAVSWSELDFPTLFSQLLRNKSDAKEHLWDVLGLADQQS